MYSRITTNYINNSIIRNINSNRDILMNLQEQVASQKKVNKPSDDPGAAVGIMNTNVYLSKIEGYLSNIKNASGEANVTDSTLSTVVEKLQRAKDLSTEGANELTDTDQLNAIAKEIEEIMNTVVDMANTQYNSKYIYSGTNTKTPAYSKANGEYKYQGKGGTTDSDKRVIQIDDDVNVCVNPGGSNLFGEYYTDPADPTQKIAAGPLGALGKLKDALNAAPPDEDTIRASIDELESNVQHITDYRTSVGNTIQTLDMMGNKYEDLKISYTDQKSNLEDVNMIEASANLTYQESVLQASLNIGQRLMQPSLLNYM